MCIGWREVMLLPHTSCSHLAMLYTQFTTVCKWHHIIIIQVDEGTTCAHPALTCKDTFSAVGIVRILFSVITCTVGHVMNKRAVWKADCLWHQIRHCPPRFPLLFSLSVCLAHTHMCILACVQYWASGCWFGCSNLPLDEGQVQLPLFAALTRHFIMVSSSLVLWSALVLVTISNTRAHTQTHTDARAHVWYRETRVVSTGLFHI